LQALFPNLDAPEWFASDSPTKTFSRTIHTVTFVSALASYLFDIAEALLRLVQGDEANKIIFM
jgi:hypothetical protein